MPDSIQHQKDDAFRNAAGRRRAFPAFLILGLLCVGLALVYVFQGMTPETWDFNMARRIPIVIALVLVGTAVGLSSVVFQTITTNYILTPSVMGLDNLYVLLQTLVLYFVGSTQLTTMQSPLCFMGALLLMVCVSTGIFSTCSVDRMAAIFICGVGRHDLRHNLRRLVEFHAGADRSERICHT